MPDKTLTKLFRELDDQGFTVVPTRSGHYSVYAPDGTMATRMASTPSDIRGRLNNLARLRQKGFVPKGEVRRTAKEKRI